MKKKLTLALALVLCTAFSSSYAERVKDVRHLDSNRNGMYEEGEIDPNCEYVTGPCVCYCKVTRFKPKYYCETHCVPEPYTVQKKCCRYVDQHYTKTHCRYVPQYYTKTYCKKVPEYYCVPEVKYRTRTVKERKCKYEPYTCWERRCIDAPSDCPTCPAAQ